MLRNIACMKRGYPFPMAASDPQAPRPSPCSLCPHGPQKCQAARQAGGYAMWTLANSTRLKTNTLIYIYIYLN